MSLDLALRWIQLPKDRLRLASVASSFRRSFILLSGKLRPRGDLMNLAKVSASLSANCNWSSLFRFLNFEIPMMTAHVLGGASCAHVARGSASKQARIQHFIDRASRATRV